MMNNYTNIIKAGKGELCFDENNDVDLSVTFNGAMNTTLSFEKLHSAIMRTTTNELIINRDVNNFQLFQNEMVETLKNVENRN